MGSQLSRIFRKKIIRICMVGLPGAGKTTIFYKIFPYEIIMPMVGGIGFNIETFEYKNLRFAAFDVNRESQLQPIWKHYFSDVDGLIFVVDSNDVVELEEAKQTLYFLLDMEELDSVPLLIFANKQDLPLALKLSDLIDRLDFILLKNREWYVQSTCALKGSGILQGLKWLHDTIIKK